MISEIKQNQALIDINHGIIATTFTEYFLHVRHCKNFIFITLYNLPVNLWGESVISIPQVGKQVEMHCVTCPESPSGRAGMYSQMILTQELILLTTFSTQSEEKLQMDLLYPALQESYLHLLGIPTSWSFCHCTAHVPRAWSTETQLFFAELIQIKE